MKKIILSFVFALLFIPLGAENVSAKFLSGGEGAITVQKSEVINDDLFIGGNAVTMHGTVNGDLFAGGDTVNIDGIVNGNVHVGAGTVNLSGQVKGNVYLGAGSANVSQSVVGGSLIIGTGNANIDKSTVVNGSLIVGAGNLSINSVVKRNLIFAAGEANIGPEVNIGRDLYYSIGNETGEIVIPSSASISGTIHKPPADFKAPKKSEVTHELDSAIKAAKVTATIGGFISALLIGYLYMTFFKKHFLSASSQISTNFWKSLGFGFLVTILALPGLFILLVTVVGIPLAGLLLLILLIGLYLAKIVVGMALGVVVMEKINRKKASTFATFAVGLLVVYVLKFIPIINAIAGIVILWSGLGALAIKFTSRSE